MEFRARLFRLCQHFSKITAVQVLCIAGNILNSKGGGAYDCRFLFLKSTAMVFLLKSAFRGLKIAGELTQVRVTALEMSTSFWLKERCSILLKISQSFQGTISSLLYPVQRYSLIERTALYAFLLLIQHLSLDSWSYLAIALCTARSCVSSLLPFPILCLYHRCSLPLVGDTT